MKKIYILWILTILPMYNFAQLSITDKQTALQLANTLVASASTNGVTLSNATLTCDSLANGLISGTSNFNISNGIVLSSGRVLTDTIVNFGWGLDGIPSTICSDAFNFPGDTTLSSTISASTYDACVLEFDLVPVGNFVEFEYVFGSEEYPEFNCSSFNDVFGFFISGPGITGQKNMALVPNTTIPVSINSINDGTGSCSPPANTTYYVTNTGNTNTMDGFTTPLIATHTVIGGQTYHLKLAIADVMDMILNSYVIIKANSLKSSGGSPASINELLVNNTIGLESTLVTNQLVIKNTNQDKYTFQIFDINGREVYQGNTHQVNTLLDVSKWTKGMYIIRYLGTTNKLYNEKFIIH